MEISEKKEVYLVRINGLPFYVKVKRDIYGNISQILEKPNLKQIPSGHYIGEHVIVGSPVENHYDHASGAIMCWEMWKEYPLKEGNEKPFNSKYWVSGISWGVVDNWANPASFAIVISG